MIDISDCIIHGCVGSYSLSTRSPVSGFRVDVAQKVAVVLRLITLEMDL